MPSKLVQYRDFTGGMARDIFPHKQALNQATTLYNYRSWRAALTKIGGQEVEIPNMPLSTPTLIDFWNVQFTNNISYFVTAKAGQVWKTAPDGTSAQITRSGGNYVNVFTGAALPNNSIWTSTQLFGGLTFVLSNESVTPQYVTSNAQISPGGLLQDLPGWLWNTPGDTNPYVAQTAKIVRAFDNQLWAGNITKKRQDGTLEYYPNLILYSDKATSPANTKGNYIPDVWQPSSGTSTVSSNWAGIASLNTSDPIIDMIPLRDTLLVFTTNRTYVVPKLPQPQAALSPQIISTTRGLLSAECAASFDGQVVMLTTDDIIITTGASIDFQSLINQRMKDYIFGELLTKNPTWQKNAFVRYNRYYHEVWVFLPSYQTPDGSCDKAAVWDIESNSWSYIEVPYCYSAVQAGTIGNGTTTGNRPWTGINDTFSRFHIQRNNALLVQDVGYQWQFGPNGQTVSPIPTLYEKVFDLEEMGGVANAVKSLNAIYPFIRGNAVDVTWQLKFSNIPFSNGVDWTVPDYTGVFTTSEDYKIDPSRGGRYMAVRITTNNTVEHEITAFDFDIEMLGRRG